MEADGRADQGPRHPHQALQIKTNPESTKGRIVMSPEVAVPGRDISLGYFGTVVGDPKTRKGYALGAVMALRVVREEMTRQDKKYAPFTSDVATVRLAIACMEDEVREVREAWQEWHQRPDWLNVRTEATQLAAVALRLVRDIGVEAVD